MNKQKRPLDDITSRSQQNKRFNSFRDDIQKVANQLIAKHKLTNSSGQPIVYVRCIELDYKEDHVHIKFKDPNPTITQTRLDAVVCACDEALLSRDGYQHLAAVVPILFCEYLVADRRNKINELINAQIHVGTFNIDQDIDQDDYFNEPSDILVNNEKVGNRAFRSLSTLLKVLIPI